jgi:hypothetical protein
MSWGNAFQLAQRVATKAERSQLDHWRPTRAQREYLTADDPYVLWRKGNQLGGTTGFLVDFIHRVRGTHPWQRLRHRPPIQAVLLSESWEQMGRAGGLMEKLWTLLPKDEIDPKIRFEPGRGISGKPPRIHFVAGPGRGSTISLGTYRQGARVLAGITVSLIGADEPIPAHILQEVMPRLARQRGLLRINFTPVPDMPDPRHLRGLIDDGAIREVHHRWEEANCWPEGAPFPFYDQATIDQIANTLPEAYRAMRIEGAWEPIFTDRWLSAWERETHVRPVSPPAGAQLVVGIDHGVNAGKQTAVLVAVSGRLELHPRAWIIDEAVTDGVTTPLQDAQAIHDMLGRHHWGWRDVDLWVGDRPSTAPLQLKRKSNRHLRRCLAEIAGVDLQTFPVIKTPRKYHGSVEDGLHLMNALLAERGDDGLPNLLVDPRAERFAEFCEAFNGSRWDPLKDVGDAGRYALEAAITRRIPSMLVRAVY